jgi:NADPH2:quinone reductase
MESTNTTTMTSLRLEGPGALEALAVTEVPRPVPGDGELLVRVHAAGVNPSDVLNAIGLPITRYPRVPGRDFAGVVEDGPAELLGARVWGAGSGDLGFTRDGSHAEYLVVPAAAAVPIPETWNFVQAAASGLAYATADIGLERGGLRPGLRVLVTGAAGGVGHAAAAIALSRGAHVIAAVKDGAEQERAEHALRAATVLTTAPATFADGVRQATDGRGVDLLYDTVGNPLFGQNLGVLAEDGTMVVIAGRPGQEVSLDLSQFYRRRLALVGVSSTRADAVWCAEHLRALVPRCEQGDLPPVGVARCYSIEQAAEAYGLAGSGRAGGRVVLTFDGVGGEVAR